jgi:BirA family transcriptional regulator, biotin operon repressor / biotin---[acetyl-CoA-carboxylase] ligase
MDAAESCLRLDAVALEKELAGNLIGRRVVVLNRASSSNDIALQMAHDGAVEGLVVFAEEQTAGRGQHGNRWESPPGKGLWFSILLHPNLTPTESAQLTTWAAQSVAATISLQVSLPARVKSPNDIYVGEHKIAGVLVEMRARAGAPHFAIVGIGINLSQTAADFPGGLQATAISLATAASRAIDRQAFAALLLRDLDRTYRATFAP